MYVPCDRCELRIGSRSTGGARPSHGAPDPAKRPNTVPSASVLGGMERTACLLSTAGMALQPTATTYHVRVGGNDDANGRTPGTA